MRSFFVASLISGASLLSGCGWWYGTSNTPSAASSDDPKAASPATSEPGAKPVDLATYKIPLTIDLPAGAAVEAVGEDVNITVKGSSVRVGSAYEETDTVAKAKAFYSKDSPVEYVKEDANLLVWKISGGQRGFLVLAEAQGKKYSCEGSGSATEIEVGITRCKSLKAAAEASKAEAKKSEAKKASVKMSDAKPVSLAKYKLPLSIDVPAEAEIVPTDTNVHIDIGDDISLEVRAAEAWEATIPMAKGTQDQSLAGIEYVKQDADVLVWKRGEDERELLVIAKHGGKTYACKGTSPTAAMNDVIACCKSLKPAK